MKKPKQASWRTLMRKASKAATPAEAKRLRDMAAARRRVERAKKGPKRVKHAQFFEREARAARAKSVKSEARAADVDRLGNPYPDHELFHTSSQESFDEAIEELENSKLLEAELELRRRDAQLIAEFMSSIEALKPNQRHGQYLTVPWSQIEAIMASLVRLRWLETK